MRSEEQCGLADFPNVTDKNDESNECVSSGWGCILNLESTMIVNRREINMQALFLLRSQQYSTRSVVYERLRPVELNTS